jgi:hypothetical protein
MGIEVRGVPGLLGVRVRRMRGGRALDAADAGCRAQEPTRSIIHTSNLHSK